MIRIWTMEPSNVPLSWIWVLCIGSLSFMTTCCKRHLLNEVLVSLCLAYMKVNKIDNYCG